MELLERDKAMAALSAELSAAASKGRMALVSGEAGIGKSALVGAFLAADVPAQNLLFGYCDPLLTPRVLGPLHDMARGGDGTLAAAVATGPREAVQAAFLDRVSASPGTAVVVIEDVHWADEATLDFIVFLGRRLERLRCLLVLTYRDDEPATDRLRQAVGKLSATPVRRIPLNPLSADAVATLAVRAGRAGQSAASLHAQTDGNPLLVAELLSADGDGVPPTVTDLVHARLAALSPAARTLVEAASVVPTRVEPWLLDALAPGDSAASVADSTHGLLVRSDQAVTFRHEVLRRAVEKLLPATSRAQLNRRVLQTLLSAPGPVDVARLAHHARECGDVPDIIRFGIAAAGQAAGTGAHREAVSHFRSVMAHENQVPPEQLPDLLERYSVEAYQAGYSSEAVSVRAAAVALREASGDRLRLGEGLRWLARLYWWDGSREAAETASARAIAVLEELGGPGPELAMAYSTQGQLDMLAHRLDEATRRSEQALVLARAIPDPETISHALTNLGSAELNRGNPTGRVQLDEAFDVAVQAELDDHAMRAIGNLATVQAEVRLAGHTLEDLDRALAFAQSRELSGWTQHLLGHRARVRLDRGDWFGAERDAHAALAADVAGGPRAVDALVPLGLLEARRGDSAAETTLAAAAEVGRSSHELQWMAPVAAALAEFAWLQGDDEAAGGHVAEVFGWAERVDHPWFAGELALWSHLAGGPDLVPTTMSDPHRLLLQEHDPAAAAAAWQALGWPYHRALALAGTGSEADALLALSLLDQLGARQAGHRLRRDLQRRGGLRVPRGPNRSSSTNVHGLTDRQLEVLRLVADGLTDADIADRLTLSVKTVGHHVSAALAKTGTTSRHQAAEALRPRAAGAKDGEPGEQI